VRGLRGWQQLFLKPDASTETTGQYIGFKLANPFYFLP
jgi:hypothetical protein